jgi:PTH1 family peptidyl-tRNA hydrolase
MGIDVSKIRLIVGLGNPGSKYESTRHNAGLWFINALAEQFNVKLKPEAKFQGNVARIQTSESDTFLLFPTGFMNRSGLAVRSLANFYKIKPEEILVAHDELDLDCGTARLKQGGGHGGHNGLRDIHAQLGDKNYYRLRLGIDHPGDKNIVVNYVLSNPSKDQKNKIDMAIEDTLFEIEPIMQGEIAKAMNNLHRKK